MKTNKIKVLCLILAICCVLSVPTHAATYASDQLTACDCTLKEGVGRRVLIGFSVEGTSIMSELGAERITIYKKVALPNGTQTWSFVESFDETDEGMVASDKHFFISQQSFYGSIGVEYKVSVTVFATDYNGGKDTRTFTRYITVSGTAT